MLMSQFIVEAAIELASNRSRLVVVGQDTDLLIPLTNNHFFNSFSQYLVPSPYTLDCLLLLHTITSCDTTSALFDKRKVKGLNILAKSQTLSQAVDVFTKENVTHQAIAEVGENFLLALYGAKTSHTLDDYRHFYYNRLISKQKLYLKFNLAVYLRQVHHLQTTHTVLMYRFGRGWINP